MTIKRQENTNHWYLNWPWCAGDDTSPGLFRWGHGGLASIAVVGLRGETLVKKDIWMHTINKTQMQITMLRSWLYIGSSRALKSPPLPNPQTGTKCVGSVCRSYIWLCQKAELNWNQFVLCGSVRFAEVTPRFNVTIGPLAFQLLPC